VDKGVGSSKKVHPRDFGKGHGFKEIAEGKKDIKLLIF